VVVGFFSGNKKSGLGLGLGVGVVWGLIRGRGRGGLTRAKPGRCTSIR
jgi:hypothetical protein